MPTLDTDHQERPTRKRRITLAFNCALFSYWIVNLFMVALSEPIDERKAFWDVFYELGPVTTIVTTVVLLLTLLVLGAILFGMFWNRLIADLFSLRELEFQEALSIMLILGILTV